MFRAAVPEAAIDEYGKAGTAENEIRTAEHWLMSAPASDACCAHHGCELELRVFVAVGTDGGHDLAALFLCENVRHPLILLLFGTRVSCGALAAAVLVQLARVQKISPNGRARVSCLVCMPGAWSREEVEAAVADYFAMLGKELGGEAYNKAEHNRQLQNLLWRRSRGSVERKHQNISAVLIDLGYPYIDGYKPLANYQELLAHVVQERLSASAGLEEVVAASVAAQVDELPAVGDILEIVVPPPVRDPEPSRLYDRPTTRGPRRHHNYLETEARNRSLGRAGEELVLRFEHERLWRAGKHSLADRIEHVARTQGDGLGYDIQSFEEDGKERLIEVKTTRFGALTPFFATRNEVEVSEERGSDYQLYRLFSFRTQPRLFTLAGSLRASCQLEPFSYSALPK